MKIKYDMIFCVLTYRNSTDLEDFLKSVQAECKFSYRIIVVNSHYDEESCLRIGNMAKLYDCDFLDVPNKGYGTGNNRGIDYALEHYEFDYLTVSNPDIIIKRFELEKLQSVNDGYGIIAPQIVCRTKKQQNPATAKNSSFANRLLYCGYKKRIKLLIYSGIIWNKLIKYKAACLHRKKRPVFQCHGSFVIFRASALTSLYPVYDENIFMFCEELDLAYKTEALGINSCYQPDISVYHKEDGSIKLSNLNVFDASRNSLVYCWEKWNIKK